MMRTTRKPAEPKLRKEPTGDNIKGDNDGKAPSPEPEKSIDFRDYRYLQRHHLSPEAAASLAVQVDAARAKVATDGKTLVYTIKWI